MRRCLIVLAVFLACGLAARANPDAKPRPDVKAAIVKIFAVHDSYDYDNPWSMRGPYAVTGSGSIISGKRILTNAHVISDETFIQVRKYGDARRYQARVLSVSHAADLALLTVDDPHFFDGVEPLDLGELPKTQQEILVYGFPLGGDTLSTTKGVVSRIEHTTYAHSSCPFLAVQIDAAVNPGNSGGPAMSEDRIVGVAMQGINNADNIGYIVPVPIIRHFLKDIEDGRYDGFPSVGIVTENTENPDLKRMYQVPEESTGMLVIKVLPNSPAEGKIQPGDVVTQVAGHPVAEDGTVEFRPRERTSLAYYVQERQVGDPLTLQVLRAGKPVSVDVVLNHRLEDDALIPMEQYEVTPSYYVFGGIVFCPLTLNLLKAWGPNWADKAPEDLVAALADNHKSADQDEIVIALKVLAADVNAGYHNIETWVVDRVNGHKVRSLKDLVGQVEQSKGFVVFKHKSGEQIVLDRGKAESAGKAILDTYRVPADRSPDLVPATNH